MSAGIRPHHTRAHGEQWPGGDKDVPGWRQPRFPLGGPVIEYGWGEYVGLDPERYSLDETFEGCLVFLAGFYSGLADQSRGGRPLIGVACLWMGLCGFLASRMGCAEIEGQACFRALRDKYPDDEEALRQMLALHREFLGRGPA